MTRLNRRLVITGASAAAACGLAGCVSTTPNPSVQAFSAPVPQPPPQSEPLQPAAPQSGVAAAGGAEPQSSAMYGPATGEPFPVPAVKLSEVNAAFLRKNVAYDTKEPPGTIVVDPANHYLYHVEEGGRATRYGVGVGREGFVWSGVATINSKQEWPDWYPPKEMLDRRPELKKQMSQLRSGTGMAGGPDNPIGARGMYLWQGKVDTLFRIHGTNEPWTIGKSVSSGCIRMINQDVIDLYARTPVGTRVVVLGTAPAKVAKTDRL
ncbi:L,D-transpeptidase [Methylocapsa aurea]|uniref:L,D-transpeptidase n=1 Tax=Methylocapsa aurea TaxID=663610 RepID=UPI00055B3E08|nr:L,D-transpeptidase [Methylocapsa aurea]